ncbi:PEG3-like protein, partial [Mya arenaria]
MCSLLLAFTVFSLICLVQAAFPPHFIPPGHFGHPMGPHHMIGPFPIPHHGPPHPGHMEGGFQGPAHPNKFLPMFHPKHMVNDFGSLAPSPKFLKSKYIKGPPRRPLGKSHPSKRDRKILIIRRRGLDGPPQPIIDKFSRPDRIGVPDQPDTRIFQDQPDRRLLPDRSDRRSFPNRPDRISYPDRPDRISYPDRPDRRSFPGRPDRISYPDRPDRRSFPGRPDRISLPDRPDRISFPDRPDRRNFPDMPDMRSFPDRPDMRRLPGGDFGRDMRGRLSGVQRDAIGGRSFDRNGNDWSGRDRNSRDRGQTGNRIYRNPRPEPRMKEVANLEKALGGTVVDLTGISNAIDGPVSVETAPTAQDNSAVYPPPPTHSASPSPSNNNDHGPEHTVVGETLLDKTLRNSNNDVVIIDVAGQYDPLRPDSVVDLTGTNNAIYNPGVEDGNVDVVTLDNAAFIKLEQAIASGQEINAALLDQLIGGGTSGIGAAASTPGSAIAGTPDIFVIDTNSGEPLSEVHTQIDISGSVSSPPSSSSSSTHTQTEISAPHGPDGHSPVGKVGDSVGSIAVGEREVMSLFSMPGKHTFPDVPASVSSIPKSIGQRMHNSHGAH